MRATTELAKLMLGQGQPSPLPSPGGNAWTAFSCSCPQVALVAPCSIFVKDFKHINRQLIACNLGLTCSLCHPENFLKAETIFDSLLHPSLWLERLLCIGRVDTWNGY